jgi:hypothetical protein
MAGNTANAAVWGGADVLVAPLGSPIPVGNAAFSAAWKFVGLLDGDQGFEEGLEVSATDHSAWGYGVIATTYAGQKTTKTFTALEENSTVMGLVYDVSDATFDDEAGTYSGDLAVKDLSTKVLVAFVTTSGDVVKRAISKAGATIQPTAAGTESETALASKGFTATIIPDANKVLWTVYKGEALDESSSSSSS